MSLGKTIQIAITGPESTGKSDLTAGLAAYFSGVSVPEYAREYLNKLGRSYRYDDILEIAKQQHRLMGEAIRETLRSSTEGLLTPAGRGSFNLGIVLVQEVEAGLLIVGIADRPI